LPPGTQVFGQPGSLGLVARGTVDGQLGRPAGKLAEAVRPVKATALRPARSSGSNRAMRILGNAGTHDRLVRELAVGATA
jgi:hypothetical protein